ncbi:MAG: hypothetical protein HQM09_04435 [Candidatus Riflebacteria bacterium]|nr:hypothetical protein [Candidatus Riflebacteria bacterium]
MSLATLLSAFCGGILGAAMGGLQAFILCGFTIVIGTGLNLCTNNPDFMQAISWGPFLSPHIAFAGGVAASAFAGRRGCLKSGREINVSLMGNDSPETLLVGGFFGLLGQLFKMLYETIPHIGSYPWTNTMALSVFTTNVIARLVFGKTGILGTVPQGCRRGIPSQCSNWILWESRPSQLIIIAIAVSYPIADMILKYPALAGVSFGIGAFSLLFLHFGNHMPVFFHIALAAETGATLSGDPWWGVTFGLLASFLGELVARLFLIHGDTHIDPPSGALVFLGSLGPLLSLCGFFSWSATIPAFSPLFVVGVALGGNFLLSVFVGPAGEKN